jgi:hypothetical protein
MSGIRWFNTTRSKDHHWTQRAKHVQIIRTHTVKSQVEQTHIAARVRLQFT